MDGFEASHLIKTKIAKEGYVNTLIIGYTADCGDEIETKCTHY